MTNVKMIGKITMSLVATVLVLGSCATQVPMQVERTPTMDTRGIERIAVMPFQAIASGSQNAAAHATSTATARIQATNRFQLVSAQEIQRLQQTGQSIEGHVDALLNGQITRLASQTTQTPWEIVDRRTGAVQRGVDHTRTVEIDFNYSLMIARDGSLIGPVNRTGRNSITAASAGALPSVDTMATQIINGQMATMYRDVAPHRVTVQRTMETERRGGRENREFRDQMSAAQAQVRAGNHIRAREAFINIWEEHHSVAAAVNAAIMYEAVGETENAAVFMEQVFIATGNPRARTVLNQLNNEIAQQAGVAAFDITRQRPVERVTELSVNQIMGLNRPDGARVLVHNNATTHQGIANDVTDNIISNLITAGIPVVERGMIDLVIREQNMQLDGFVNDNDLVSIGNLAGANKIAVVNITGTGGSRRLQLRVLDIETGTVIMQSGTGREWAI